MQNHEQILINRRLNQVKIRLIVANCWWSNNANLGKTCVITS